MVKNLPAYAGDTGDLASIPGSGRSPGVGNDNPFQYSCLENSMDRRAWLATVHGIAKSRTHLIAPGHSQLTHGDPVFFAELSTWLSGEDLCRKACVSAGGSEVGR